MPLFPPGFALGVGWVGFVVYDCIFRLWETPISEARSGAPSFVVDFRPGPPATSIRFVRVTLIVGSFTLRVGRVTVRDGSVIVFVGSITLGVGTRNFR